MDNDNLQWRISEISVAKGYLPGEGPIRFDVPNMYMIPIHVAHIILVMVSFINVMFATQGAAFWIGKKWGRSERRQVVQEKTQEKGAQVECTPMESDLILPPAEKLVYVTWTAIFIQSLYNTAIFSLTKAVTCGMWESDWDGTFPMTAAAVAGLLTLLVLTMVCSLLAWAFRKDLRMWYRTILVATRQGPSDSKENTNASAQRNVFQRIWTQLCAVPKLLYIWIPLWILSWYAGVIVGDWLWPYIGHRWLEPLFNYS